MVKNFGKGGSGHKKMKNSTSTENYNKELIFKENEEDYALVTELLGNGRCNVYLYNDFINKRLIKINAIIRGNMRKRQVNRIIKEDIVLISLREYQLDKVDIINKYTDIEVKRLIDYNEISNDFLNCNNLNFKFKTELEFKQNNDDCILFTDVSDI